MLSDTYNKIIYCQPNVKNTPAITNTHPTCPLLYMKWEVPHEYHVEGILIFQNPTLRDMFDIKIFVETDADVRILRRALRDVEERGRTLQSVVTQYLTTVKPMHEQYVEPSRKFADIIVLEGGRNLVALEMIMQRIRAHIDTP